MDTEKATVRLKLDKDELATLTARIYQESGHGLAPDDPIIVQYLMHKIMLTQFLETQGKAMTAFADSLLPHILETEGRFEENKAAFIEHLANAKKESLQAVHDQYTTMVKGTFAGCPRKVAFLTVISITVLSSVATIKNTLLFLSGQVELLLIIGT